jgi:hypothetical protein
VNFRINKLILDFQLTYCLSNRSSPHEETLGNALYYPTTYKEYLIYACTDTMSGQFKGTFEDRWYVTHSLWNRDMIKGLPGLLPAPQRCMGRKMSPLDLALGRRTPDDSGILFRARKVTVHEKVPLRPPFYEEMIRDLQTWTLYVDESNHCPSVT